MAGFVVAGCKKDEDSTSASAAPAGEGETNAKANQATSGAPSAMKRPGAGEPLAPGDKLK